MKRKLLLALDIATLVLVWGVPLAFIAAMVGFVLRRHP